MAIDEKLFGKDSKVMKSVGLAKHMATSSSPMTIVGEIGVGKKTMAKFIHQMSGRVEHPFSIVDCLNDPRYVENQILGHRDETTGKFHKGELEKCDKGTVVLENVDGLDEKFQKRFHQILLELPDYDLDVRIISTTSKNLSKLVGAGRFYRALYTLISTTNIVLPPIRERVGDIEYLSKYFVKEYSQIHEKDELGISESAINKLTSHYWTHNVSELKVVIEDTIKNCENKIVELDDLYMGDKKSDSKFFEESDDGMKLMSLKEAEKLLIKKALIHTSENRTQAAKILGVSIRTLRNKINEYRNEGANYFVNLR